MPPQSIAPKHHEHRRDQDLQHAERYDETRQRCRRNDGADRSADGPFGAIDGVPTLVILDANGRERYRHAGVLSNRALDEALTKAE